MIKKNSYIKKKLIKSGIIWIPLKFRALKLHFFLRVFTEFHIRYLTHKYKIDLVHLRGGFPGLIYFFTFLKGKYLYDLRSFWGQWAEARSTYNSLTYKLALKLESFLIKNASGIIVLDKSGEDYINQKYNLKTPIKVIPTATDIEKFSLVDKKRNDSLNFVYLGGAEYPPYRVKDCISLMKKFMNNGIACRIDFINKNDHKFIKK